MGHDRKKDRKRVYTNVQLTALLKRSEIVIAPSKYKNKKAQGNGKRQEQ